MLECNRERRDARMAYVKAGLKKVITLQSNLERHDTDSADPRVRDRRRLSLRLARRTACRTVEHMR